MTRLYIDFETRGVVDLREVGSWIYSRDPGTDILCMAFALDDEPVNIRRGDPVTFGASEPCRLVDLLEDPSVEVWAHNSTFERHAYDHILRDRYGWPHVAFDRWRCSMAQARHWALPGKLEDAARVLQLLFQKDKAGHNLMMKMCKPRRLKAPGIHWHESPEELERLYQYCKQDVEVERQIATTLPELPQDELALWRWTERLNDNGLLIDMKLVDAVQSIVSQLDERDMSEFQQLTNHEIESPRQVALLKDWLSEHGLRLDNLQAETIDRVLAEPLGKISTEVRKALEARRNLSKSSLAKYSKMKSLADPADGRARGHIVYSPAHTRRWAGRGIQTQNLPSRTSVSKQEIKQAVDIFKLGDLALCESMLSNVRELASLSIRSALVAGEGKAFVAADYSSIEARVLLWLCDAPQLEILRDGRNLYVEMAERIYNRKIDKNKDQVEYFLSKSAVLGLGYGMGSKKFRDTCAKYGVDISEDFAQSVVDNYRTWMSAVPDFWYGIERAFFEAMARGEATYGKLKVVYRNSTLRVHIPGSAPQIYWYPEIGNQETSWGEIKPQISFFKQYSRTSIYGGKMVENAVQAIARNLLKYAALNIERTCPAYEPVLTVHDELVYEVDESIADLQLICSKMCELPDWAEGIPLTAEGWVGKRYRK